MAQHHFVVIYDDERAVWEYDAEQTGFAFHNGEIWDERKEEFFCAYGKDTPEELTDTNDRAAGHLAFMLALGQFSRDSVS